MTNQRSTPDGEEGKLDGLLSKFDEAVSLLDKAPAVSKVAKLPRVMDTARRILMVEGGCAALEARAANFEAARVFVGSDWETPSIWSRR